MLFVFLLVSIQLMQASRPPSSSQSRQGPVDVRKSGPFVALAKGARKRDELDRHLRQALPSALRDQIRLADLKDGRLVFLAPTPAWASRLRLSQTQILAAARAMGVPARSISVKVTPPAAAPIPEPPRRMPLSATTASHLKAAARSLSDPELQDLFLALASVADISDSPHETD